jgi:hypothetical protein
MEESSCEMMACCGMMNGCIRARGKSSEFFVRRYRGRFRYVASSCCFDPNRSLSFSLLLFSFFFFISFSSWRARSVEQVSGTSRSEEFALALNSRTAEEVPLRTARRCDPFYEVPPRAVRLLKVNQGREIGLRI